MKSDIDGNLAAALTGASESATHAERQAPGDFAKALIVGLSAKQKAIPCRFFYDAAGSALFERITELPEYYPTRTEMSILASRASEIPGRC